MMRQEAKKTLEKDIVGRLIALGMPNVTFEVKLTQTAEPGWSGIDKVEFRFSANKNVPTQPLSQIASGGEIARVMLSLKALIASTAKLPTIIFDEIDTGVSGKIAEQMALMMQGMSRQGCQVVSITHLPQIAARGQHHYKVFKEEGDDSTLTHITELSATERIEEVAHMLSGSTLTEAALNNAKELLSSEGGI
jgi:DNA repair protein RecN (Recombination protein N)